MLKVKELQIGRKVQTKDGIKTIDLVHGPARGGRQKQVYMFEDRLPNHNYSTSYGHLCLKKYKKRRY